MPFSCKRHEKKLQGNLGCLYVTQAQSSLCMPFDNLPCAVVELICFGYKVTQKVLLELLRLRVLLQSIL